MLYIQKIGCSNYSRTPITYLTPTGQQSPKNHSDKELCIDTLY